MTSRERVEAALNHREPDRTPVFEYVLQSPIASRLLGRPFTGDSFDWAGLREHDDWRKTVRQLAVDYVDLAALLGHDLMYVVPNPLMPSPPAPVVSGKVDEAGADPVEVVRRRNAGKAQSPFRRPAEQFLVYEDIKEEMKRRGMDLPILAPAYAHGVWTDIDLMQTMILDPDVAREHFELATRVSLALVDTYVQLGIDLVGVGGDFAGNRPLISPECYREFIMPEVRKVSRRVHEAGGWAVNASDGNLWSVLDDFLVGTEVDAYLEIDLHAGMDLRRLKKEHGGRITFFGNLDCGNTLSFGSREDVRRHVLDCLEAGRGQGGHILCASNAITASVPFENYLEVVNAYRDRFGLPAFYRS